MTKAWEKFWGRFDFAMKVLPEAMDEAMAGGIPDSIIMTSINGDVVLRGRIKSLRINGKLIRFPAGVLEG